MNEEPTESPVQQSAPLNTGDVGAISAVDPSETVVDSETVPEQKRFVPRRILGADAARAVVDQLAFKGVDSDPASANIRRSLIRRKARQSVGRPHYQYPVEPPRSPEPYVPHHVPSHD